MKALDGIVFHDRFEGSSPKITVWKEGSFDRSAMPVVVLISDNKLPPKYYTEQQMQERLSEIISIGKSILREYDDKLVELHTPIAYFRKFEALRKWIKDQGEAVLVTNDGPKG